MWSENTICMIYVFTFLKAYLGPWNVLCPLERSIGTEERSVSAVAGWDAYRSLLSLLFL